VPVSTVLGMLTAFVQRNRLARALAQAGGLASMAQEAGMVIAPSGRVRDVDPQAVMLDPPDKWEPAEKRRPSVSDESTTLPGPGSTW